MRNTLVLACAAAATTLSGCATYGGGGYGAGPSSDGYWEREYRPGDYAERGLRDDDTIYRGRDGRYYCKRDDGSTGLVVGGIAGGVLGNIIAPGGSKTLGTILGAAGGAVAGRAIDRNDARCR